MHQRVAVRRGRIRKLQMYVACEVDRALVTRQRSNLLSFRQKPEGKRWTKQNSSRDRRRLRTEGNQFIRTEIAKSAPTNRRRLIEKFILAALGSIPWVEGLISAAVNYKTEEGAIRTDNLQRQWLEEHGWKIAELMQDLEDIVERFEAFGPDVDKRIQSDEYLALVRRAFRV